MKDIDEAIQHCEDVAQQQDMLKGRYDDASGYTRSGNEAIRTSDAKKCEKCAADHRQLAEWLKDYKLLLEQEPVLDKIRAEIEQKIEQERFARSVFRGEEKDAVNAEQCTGSIFAYKNVVNIIDKYKGER